MIFCLLGPRKVKKNRKSGVFNFQNSKRKADQINSIVLRESKKVNIFEITVLRLYMYIYIFRRSMSYWQRLYIFLFNPGSSELYPPGGAGRPGHQPAPVLEEHSHEGRLEAPVRLAFSGMSIATAQ